MVRVKALADGAREGGVKVLIIAGSSNGRTPAFGAVRWGFDSSSGNKVKI
jgi:hypothetical protein